MQSSLHKLKMDTPKVNNILPMFFYAHELQKRLTHELQKGSEIDIHQFRSSDNLADFLTYFCPLVYLNSLFY